MTALLVKRPRRWSARSTPRARAPPTSGCGPGVRWLAGRLDLRCAVSDDAEALARRVLGGDYELLFNGDRDRALRRGRAVARPSGPTDLLLGRHEPRKGLAVLLEAHGRPARATCGCGWRSDGPETERARAPVRRRPPHRVARAASATTRRRPGCGAPTCSAPRRCGASPSASCCSRRWPPARRSWPRDLPGYRQRGPPTASTPCWCRPGDAGGPGRRARAGCSTDRHLARRAGGVGRASGPPSSRWTGWPTATSSSTSRRCAAVAAGPRRRSTRSRPPACRRSSP